MEILENGGAYVTAAIRSKEGFDVREECGADGDSEGLAAACELPFGTCDAWKNFFVQVTANQAVAK